MKLRKKRRCTGRGVQVRPPEPPISFSLFCTAVRGHRLKITSRSRLQTRATHSASPSEIRSVIKRTSALLSRVPKCELSNGTGGCSLASSFALFPEVGWPCLRSCSRSCASVPALRIFLRIMPYAAKAQRSAYLLAAAKRAAKHLSKHLCTARFAHISLAPLMLATIAFRM